MIRALHLLSVCLPMMPVELNAFHVMFSKPTFTANVADFPDPEALPAFRKMHGAEWFLYWRNGKLYCIPKVPKPTRSIGVPKTLAWGGEDDHDHLRLLTARLTEQLPEKFPERHVLRQRPFLFVGKKNEIVTAATAGWRDLPELVRRFKINPTFELDSRIIELRPGDVQAALCLSVHTKWQIEAPLDALVEAGIDLAGLHVVRRDPAPEQRRLIGRIGRVTSDQVQLSESYDDRLTIPISEVWLEGRRDSFSRCLRSLLGSRYERFDSARYIQESNLLNGPALHDMLHKMQEYLWNASPVSLTPDLTCDIGRVIELNNTAAFTSVVRSKPARYCFDPSKAQRSDYAWPGLEKYGPFDRDTISKRTPRILVVTPDTSAGKTSQFIKMLRDGIASIPGSRYEKGFARTFGLVNPEFVTCSVPFHGATAKPPSQLYRQAVASHLERDPAFDAAIVVISDEHAFLPDSSSPYLHTKAVLLMAGVPAQLVRLGTITKAPKSLQSTMQNIAVALYAKLGGVPWTIDQDQTVDDEIVVGMGMAEVSGSRFETRQRHIGITTVFQGDGNYLLSNLSRECSYDEYPNELRASMLAVLSEIKHRNRWRVGETVRVVFHAAKPLKNVEVADIVEACIREVCGEQTVQFAFLTVNTDHAFKLLDPSQPGLPIFPRSDEMKGIMAPERGTLVQLGRYTRLVSTNGPRLIKKSTSPLPAPLLVHLHRQSTYVDQTYLAEQVLKFTALSWRSVLPAERPVTIYYSELIADLLVRLKAVPGWSAMGLNTKLRASKWFL